ncbi:MAG TPA: hypothetical protein VHX52_13970 [Steroidobacteraceae bacterium]|jgi:hypothetical protein|nr:hypothetical protein [Steroidobacteraceae bacterium]
MSEPIGTGGTGGAPRPGGAPSAPPPSSSAPPSARLLGYLDAFGQRLRRAVWLRAAAVLALAALAVTLWGSAVVIHNGFGGGTLALVRAVLLGVLAALSLGLLVLPLRRLRHERDRKVEALAREFDGRLRTFADLERTHPFKELLAQDALTIAARHPPRSHVGRSRLALPGAAAAALVLALVWLACAGPGLYRYGTRAIWAGWLFRGLLPAQRIDVDPGDQAVRRGGNVTVRSWPRGFDPATAQLHARVGGGSWQQIDMTGGGGDFTFTFFSVRDPVSYYVSAAGVRSPTYALKVVDVPNVDRLRLVYHYPDWTKLPPKTQDGDGDISAIAGTRVELQAHTDSALAAGELVLDAAATPLTTHGNEASAHLQVTRDARYYLAARIGGERVRLTDDYLIKLQPLGKPQVHITWPGRDYSASSIEEVSTQVQASDDFGLQSLELHYSINGGAWQSVALPAKGREASDQHVFMLESMRPQQQRALAPGDMISYYAVARDHAQATQSDMYFINVQPFDRRFSQASAAGGGGGDEQQQIAQRQREILVSTWNLLRQKRAASAAAALHDNATLLANLQGKLASQAQTLAARAQARELVASDPKITRFVDSMKRAAGAMQPAAKQLAATQLEAALAPEQQALQYLMQAASQFTDVQVAMQRGGNNPGDQSGRDLSQIYQLEMDLHKNQYESGNDASPQAGDRQSDELARRLQSLAQREQQLADQMQHASQLTPEQRWQQQTLQREAQDLQQQLSQLQQQQLAQGQPGQGQQGQGQQGQGAQGNQLAQANGAQSGSGAAGATGAPAGVQPGAGGGGQPGGSAGQLGGGPLGADTFGGTVLAGRLGDAISAMGQAAAAMRANDAGAAARARSAVQQAQRALAGAGTQLARDRAQAMQQAVDTLAERAGQLYSQQAATQAELQAAAAGAARAGGAGAHGELPGGGVLDGTPQAQLAQQKRELSAGVQRLGDQIDAAAARYRGDSPQTSQALADAARVVADNDLTDRLGNAALAIDQGQGGYVLPGEGAVTQGLRQLRDQLQAAARTAGGAVATARAAPDALASQLAQVRERRIQLQRLADTRQAASGGTGRDAAVTAQLRTQITQLEQLELQLERREQTGQAVRAAVTNPGADQYRDAVAEYYRRLGRQ